MLTKVKILQVSPLQLGILKWIDLSNHHYHMCATPTLSEKQRIPGAR